MYKVFKFGYEDYWTGSAGDKLAEASTISSSYGSSIEHLTINVDNDQVQSAKYNVRNVPTLILVENGIEKNRLIGLQTAEKILSLYHG